MATPLLSGPEFISLMVIVAGRTNGVTNHALELLATLAEWGARRREFDSVVGQFTNTTVRFPQDATFCDTLPRQETR